MNSIKGVTKTEANYRQINLDSSSSLKDFSFDRKKYFRKYIMNDDVQEKENKASNMGKLVETLLFEPELFDEKFYMSTCVSEPTAMMLDFVEALYKHTAEATNEEGEINKTFEEISRLAYEDSGYKIKYEAVMAKFSGSDAEIYYDEIRTVRSRNLTVVTAQDVTNAENIVEELKTNFVTKEIVNLTSSKRYSVFPQLQIENYHVQGHAFKSMLDLVVCDHDEKTIQPYDLKCTWSVENFFEDYYLYRRAYIQGYLYYHACRAMTLDEDSEMYGYTIKNIIFIVCDSTNYMNPLLYPMTEDDMKKAERGFDHKGRRYPGVSDIIDDLQWALENNIWKISHENYVSNGVAKLK